MYGDAGDAEFSHIEGYEDHSVNVLCTWDTLHNLTGIVVNIACPSQDTEHLHRISADYWHDTRLELRGRLGTDLFIMARQARRETSPRICCWARRLSRGCGP